MLSELDGSPARAEAAEAVPVGRGIVEPVELHREKPVYPEPARLARRQGVVAIECVVTKDGNVRNLAVVRKSGSLDSIDDAPDSLEVSALSAVSRWHYRPASFGGRTVPVFLTVTVTFRLEKR